MPVTSQKILIGIKKLGYFVFAASLLFPTVLCASFVESTMGLAVVNDATAAFYNPASLVQLKSSQFISLNTYAQFSNYFTGQTTLGGFTQAGDANIQTNYFLPSLYLGIPIMNRVTLGLAVVGNSFNKDFESNSILRYAQSNSSTESIDFVPALGVKINQYLALGAGMNFSIVRMWLNPIIGFPGLNIPDSQSHNSSSGEGFGGDVGFLLTPRQGTLIGFNYRTAVTYPMSGTSTLDNPAIVSNHYQFNIWTPANAVLTIGQLVTPSLGFISTVHYIQWDIYKDMTINGIAGPQGITNGTAYFRLHNSWILTFGGQYRIIPKLVFRAASSYIQSPASGNYQISNGDGLVLGASVGYQIIKNIALDSSYAHEFVGNKSINITTGRNIIMGVNTGARDSVSLKLTINM